MAQNANLSTTAGLSPTMQTYYDRKMILDMKPKLVHYQYGQKRPLPHGSGKQVSFRKWTPFSAVSNALTEGVAPDGQALSLTAVTPRVIFVTELEKLGYQEVGRELEMALGSLEDQTLTVIPLPEPLVPEAEEPA